MHSLTKRYLRELIEITEMNGTPVVESAEELQLILVDEWPDALLAMHAKLVRNRLHHDDGWIDE